MAGRGPIGYDGSIESPFSSIVRAVFLDVVGQEENVAFVITGLGLCNTNQ
jgi:hypothetical protein